MTVRPGHAAAADRRGFDADDPRVTGFLEMIAALRAVQDDLTAAAPPPEVVTEATRLLAEVSAAVRPYAVGERDQVTGRVRDVPGRGQAMVPVIRLDDVGTSHVGGRVRFSRHHLGGNGAAHGGAIALVFDDLLGRAATGNGRSRSRTAYLHVDYRSITPIERDLRIEARFVREEGRKRFLVGAIHDGDTLCAEANGLFVALNPGQP